MSAVLLSLTEAAALLPDGYGTDTLRAAINQPDPHAFPPPLKAKRGKRNQYLILPADLAAWAESFPDA